MSHLLMSHRFMPTRLVAAWIARRSGCGTSVYGHGSPVDFSFSASFGDAAVPGLGRNFAIGVLLAWCFLGSPAVSSAEDLYVDEVKPLLAEKCVSCHGPVRQEAGLRLDAASLILRGGDSGEVVVSGDADDSELIWRVTAEGGSRMPPDDEGTPLTEGEVATLTTWIAEGLPAPADETVLEGPGEHWAFRPIRRPEVSAAGSSEHPIDALFEAKLEGRGLVRAAIADRETILRRLTFGLLGLPPTPEQRARFLAITSDAGERRFVDRLLADPAYAERWARHWMDVWRYSDWSGYKNQLRGSQRHIWRWRDWIVESLAEDRPYDEMIRQMLAADELSPLDDDALRATGYLARNYHNSNRNIWLDATVEHTAKAFVGLTIDCARCHDHKYDPLTQEEYYRFRAVFEPHHVRTDRVAGVLDTAKDGVPRAYDKDLDAETQFLIGGNEKMPDESREIRPGVPEILGLPLEVRSREVPVLASHPELRADRAREVIEAAERAVDAARAGLEGAGSDAKGVAAAKLRVAESELADKRARLAADRAKYLDAGEADLVTLAAAAAARQRELAVAKAKVPVAEAEAAVAKAKRALSKGDDGSGTDSESPELADSAESNESPELKKARESLDSATKELAKVVKTAAASETGTTGDSSESKISDYKPFGTVYPERTTGRRAGLAEWITRPDNPLTARVAVNHVWTRHFGQPLVDNTFDFGLRSPRPVHHELLDWLAAELIESGWSLQHLHRLIVTSRVYRQASQLPAEADRHNRGLDPDNAYFWHFNVIRLEAEVIRDAMMATAGGLDRRQGGPDIDYALGEEVHRRSLYFRHAYEKQMTMLTTFDAASPNECYRRSPSIIPQQALVLSNSELSRKMASRLTEQIRGQESETGGAVSGDVTLTSKTSDAAESFVRRAFVRVLGRVPDSAELDACVRFLESGEPEVNLVHALMNHNDFVVIR